MIGKAFLIGLGIGLIISLLFLLLTNTNSPLVFGDEPHYINIDRCPDTAQRVIALREIDPNKINTCGSKDFLVDGRTVSLVGINFGEPNDCPSGCFYSHYCSILDRDDDYPFALELYNMEDYVRGVTEKFKSDPNGFYGADTEPILTGTQHELTETDQFQEYAQVEERTPLYPCTYRWRLEQE